MSPRLRVRCSQPQICNLLSPSVGRLKEAFVNHSAPMGSVRAMQLDFIFHSHRLFVTGLLMLENKSSQSADNVAGKSMQLWNADMVKTTCWRSKHTLQLWEESGNQQLCTWLLVPIGRLVSASTKILLDEHVEAQ